MFSYFKVYIREFKHAVVLSGQGLEIAPKIGAKIRLAPLQISFWCEEQTVI